MLYRTHFTTPMHMAMATEGSPRSLSVSSLTDVHHLRSELERGSLEADVAGRVAKDKAEVNVHDVSVYVQHDVAVVAGERAGRWAGGQAGNHSDELQGTRVCVLSVIAPSISNYAHTSLNGANESCSDG